MLKTQVSTLDDFPQWLRLAGEIEPLFGPMVEDPRFSESLRRAIAAKEAFCIRNLDGDKQQTLQGGIVICRKKNEILWFAVAEKSRRQGIGKALLEEAIRQLDSGRSMIVTTFAESVEKGFPARKLYHLYSFKDYLPGDLNPAGIPTVIMIRFNK
jgi:ribosomal protein S18 acetylase RimI-like enzyme